MFQFRRFPSYTYLIQCTILEYCSSGFPHSEISGSTDICSSPKLIAACHVLLRLLMPRHPPCALFRLTSLYDLHHSAVLKKRIMQVHLQNFEIVIVTLAHLPCACSTIFYRFSVAFAYFFPLFSFQGAVEDIHEVYPLN